MFARPAGGHKCIKEHLECPNKSENQRHPAKVLNSDFYLCPEDILFLRARTGYVHFLLMTHLAQKQLLCFVSVPRGS